MTLNESRLDVLNDQLEQINQKQSDLTEANNKIVEKIANLKAQIEKLKEGQLAISYEWHNLNAEKFKVQSEINLIK